MFTLSEHESSNLTNGLTTIILISRRISLPFSFFLFAHAFNEDQPTTTKIYVDEYSTDFCMTKTICCNIYEKKEKKNDFSMDLNETIDWKKRKLGKKHGARGRNKATVTDRVMFSDNIKR